VTEFARRCLYFGDQQGGSTILENRWFEQLLADFEEHIPIQYAAVQFRWGVQCLPDRTPECRSET
jgi:hypothetical protein